jgi:hypothetical protein
MNLNYVRKTKNKTNNELSKLYEKRQPPSIVRHSDRKKHTFIVPLIIHKIDL